VTFGSARPLDFAAGVAYNLNIQQVSYVNSGDSFLDNDPVVYLGYLGGIPLGHWIYLAGTATRGLTLFGLHDMSHYVSNVREYYTMTQQQYIAKVNKYRGYQAISNAFTLVRSAVALVRGELDVSGLINAVCAAVKLAGQLVIGFEQLPYMTKFRGLASPIVRMVASDLGTGAVVFTISARNTVQGVINTVTAMIKFTLASLKFVGLVLWKLVSGTWYVFTWSVQAGWTGAKWTAGMVIAGTSLVINTAYSLSKALVSGVVTVGTGVVSVGTTVTKKVVSTAWDGSIALGIWTWHTTGDVFTWAYDTLSYLDTGDNDDSSVDSLMEDVDEDVDSSSSSGLLMLPMGSSI